MICPIDEHPMTVHSSGQLQAESCPHGHGVWLGHTGFVAFKGLRRVLESPELTETLVAVNRGFSPPVRFGSDHYKCPQCDQAFQSRDAEGALIDVCIGCGGAWLDAGELEHVMPIYVSNPEGDSGAPSPVLDAAYLEQIRTEASRGNPDLWPARLNREFGGKRPRLKLRFKQDRLQILLDADDVPAENVGIELRFNGLESLDLSGVRQYKVYAVPNGSNIGSGGWSHEFEQSGSSKGGRFHRFSFNDPVRHALALPVAALIAMIINGGPGPGVFGFFHV
jgi:Zn-finger nucleic acid-binding protein